MQQHLSATIHGRVQGVNSLILGPRFAKVESIKSEYTDATGEFKEFKVIRDKRFIKDQIRAYQNLARKLVE